MAIRPRTKMMSLVLLALLLAGLAGCAKLKARDELNKGVRSFKAANYDKAIIHFKTALENDPNLTVARLYLATAVRTKFIPGAMSEKNIGVAREAIAEFEKVLDVEPENTIALRHIASIYFQIRDMDMAKETRRRLIKIDPDNPEHYYTIGVINWTIAFEQRNILRARLGIRDQPDRPLPRRNIGPLREQNWELVEEAIEALDEARELNPNDWQIATYLNLIYREKADLVTDRDERETLLHTADVFFDEATKLQKMPAEEESTD